MKRHILALSLIAVISFSLYANTLKNGFVYDDEFTIVNNTLIKDLSHLDRLFYNNNYFARSAEKSYRPVVTFTYFIDYALYGLRPWGYHLTNIILHATNGVLLYAFLILLFKQAPFNNPAASGLSLNNPSLPITLLFITHPVLTEAVNAISYREDLLAFSFYMGVLIIYLLLRLETHSTLLLYPLSCLLYLLALLSKEMALTLPLIAYSLDLICSSSKNKNRIFPDRYIIGYICITFLYLYLYFHLFYNPIEKEAIRWTLSQRLLTIPWLISKYLLLLLAPVNLSADYVVSPIKSLSSPAFIISLSIVISMLIIAFMTLKKERKRSILPVALFFVITLIPVYNIIPLVNPFAERYIYLPAVGYSIVAWSTISFMSKYNKRYISIIFFIVLALYSIATLRRNTVWTDNLSLWSDTVKKVPKSSRAHSNLGNAYADKGKLGQAVEQYKTALSLNPRNVQAHNNLGSIYADQGLSDEAIGHYNTALRLRPDNPETLNCLGDVYHKIGQLDRAVWHYEAALKLKPDHVKAHNNLGNAYADKGQIDRAIQHYETALKLNPDFVEAYNNLSIAYADQGRLDESQKAAITALQLKPDYPDAHYNLAHIYLKKGLKEEARKEFEVTLKLSPGFVEAKKALESIE